MDPPLTTVHQPMEELGALAATLLLDQLGDEIPPLVGERLLPAELVSRESVARRPGA
jgi:DNA-binding LacI/PurR family transcriptional regulator